MQLWQIASHYLHEKLWVNSSHSKIRGCVREGVSLGSAACSTAVADARIRQMLVRRVKWHDNIEDYVWT